VQIQSLESAPVLQPFGASETVADAAVLPASGDPFLQEVLQRAGRPDRLAGDIRTAVFGAAAAVSCHVLGEERGRRSQGPLDHRLVRRVRGCAGCGETPSDWHAERNAADIYTFPGRTRSSPARSPAAPPHPAARRSRASPDTARTERAIRSASGQPGRSSCGVSARDSSNAASTALVAGRSTALCSRPDALRGPQRADDEHLVPPGAAR
jgi:hypothetical protein